VCACVTFDNFAWWHFEVQKKTSDLLEYRKLCNVGAIGEKNAELNTDGDMSNKYFWGLLETAFVVGEFTPLSTSEMLHSTSFFGSHFSTMGFKFLSHGHPYNFG
jgi:hypothetical protein